MASRKIFTTIIKPDFRLIGNSSTKLMLSGISSCSQHLKRTFHSKPKEKLSYGISLISLASASLIDPESKQAEKNKLYITHLQQVHLPPFCSEVSHEDLESVAYSQYQVAKTILSNPDAIVLQESLFENYTPELAKKLQSGPEMNIPKGRMGLSLLLYSGLVRVSPFKTAETIFPSGIPNSFSELEPSQKEFLAKKGGARTLFYLGKLTHIYKTSNEEECKLVDAAVARGNMDAIFEPRENQAIYWAKQASLESGKNKILLIFGKDHDFAKRIERLKDPSVTLHEKIDTTVGGPTDTSSISSQKQDEDVLCSYKRPR